MANRATKSGFAAEAQRKVRVLPIADIRSIQGPYEDDVID